MLQMQQHQGGLMRRLCVIGIPAYTRQPFLDLLVKWERCSGVEWTIKRLKGLKIDLIRSQTGLAPLTWVRKNRRNEIAGTVGSLFRWANSSERNFSRCVQAFMAYTFYILPDLTENQKKKFLAGINPKEVSDGLSVSFHMKLAMTVRATLRRRSPTRCPGPLVTYQGSPDKKSPRLFGQRSVPQSEQILDDLQILNTTSGMELYSKYRRLFEPLLNGIGLRKKHLNGLRPTDTLSSPVRCGEIHFLQEPGGKLRSVASPFRIFQQALRPLGLELYDVIRSLPWDCTHDQERAIPHIQSYLWQGKSVHSVDLSSATDLFPLSVQETVLKNVISKDCWDHVELWKELSRGTWKSPIGVLQWTKGQPLGMFPSFAAFSLSHGMLLLHLNNRQHDDKFFVVGDDVVILDESLYKRYIATLDRMGCPWSPDKSIVSDKLSEFAGKIVTKSRVIPQLKWRKMSDDNFLDICRLLGRQSYSLLNKRQKRVFDQVAYLCNPVGLNFSLPGDNLETMVMRTLDFYRPDKVVLGALMGLRRKINHLVYTSSEDFDSSELKSISATFDEKVKSALSKTVFSNWDTSCSIGLEGLETLPEALDIRPRLPLRESCPSRVSTLVRYEGLIRLHR